MRLTTKKTALLASVALLITVTAALGQRFTPIKNLRLDGNMDGNAQNITNVNSITAGSFIGDGSDLTGLPGLSSTGRVVSLTTENFEIDADYNYQDIRYGLGVATPPVTRTATLVDTPSPGETIFFSITASGFVPTTNVLAVSVPSTTWSQGDPEIPYGEKWLFMLFCAEEGAYDGYYIQETTSGGVSGDQPWSNTDGDYVTLTNITALSVNDAGSTVLYANTDGAAPAPVHVTTNMQIDGELILLTEGTATNAAITKNYVDTEIAAIPGPLDSRTATNNVDMGGFNITSVTNITFAGAPEGAGILSWNADEETLDLAENGTTLQLGQELHINARNATGVTITNGAVVSFAGTIGESSRIQVEPFLADGATDLYLLLGVATEDIEDGADGKVTHFGKVRGLDTSDWAPGTDLYASETVAGGFTTNAPSGTNQAIVVAIVINQHPIVGTIEVVPNWSDANAGDNLGNHTATTNLNMGSFPIVLGTEGTATNHVVTKAYVDTQVAGAADTDWADSGDTLKSTNNTVLIAGAGLAANHDQLIVSNDVRVAFRVDEDGDASFLSWYDDAVADGRSYAKWQAFFDFRHIVDYDEYWRIEGSVIEEMTFNITRKNLDYIFNGDTKENLLYMDADTDSVNIHTNTTVSGYGFTVATNAYVIGPVALETEGTATNHLVTKAYVDTAVAGAGGGSTPPREYNLPAIGAPPYGGVSGSEAMAEQTVFATNSLSIVTLNFDETTEEIIGPYYLAMPNNVDTNTDFSVTFYSWGDAAGDVTVALGYEVGGLATPTWETNTFTVTTNYASFGQDTFTFDVNPADRAHTRWWIKRVAGDSGDTSAGDWNLVNTLLEAPRE